MVNLSKENREWRERDEKRRREESFEHLVIRGYNFGEYFLLLLIFATKKKHFKITAEEEEERRIRKLVKRFSVKKNKIP